MLSYRSRPNRKSSLIKNARNNLRAFFAFPSLFDLRPGDTSTAGLTIKARRVLLPVFVDPSRLRESRAFEFLDVRNYESFS